MSKWFFAIFIISLFGCNVSPERQLQNDKISADSSKVKHLKIKTQKCFKNYNGELRLVEVKEFDKNGNNTKLIFYDDYGKLNVAYYSLYDNKNRLIYFMGYVPHVDAYYQEYESHFNDKIGIYSMYNSKFAFRGCSIRSKNSFDSIAMCIEYNEKYRFNLLLKYKYNYKHQLIEISDSATSMQEKTTFEYDSIGNLIMKNTEGEVTDTKLKYKYDKLRRVISSQEYAYHFCMMKTKDPSWRIEKNYEYDSLGNLKNYLKKIIYLTSKGNERNVIESKYQYAYEFYNTK